MAVMFGRSAGLSRRPAKRSAIICDAPDRRDVLCGGGAAFSLLLAGLLGGSRPAKKEALSGPVPELDGVLIRIVTDSYQFAVAPGQKTGDLAVQHFGWGISPDQPPGRTMASEFGLSMHITSQRGQETRRTLVDFGFT